jgi:TonB family protein
MSFAVYLNKVHRAPHPRFADDYLEHRPPASFDAKYVLIELVIDSQTGNLTQTGVVQSSGDKLLDEAALAAAQRTFPVLPVPPAIASNDGNVYFTWEMHNDPKHACSTYYVHPYLFRD